MSVIYAAKLPDGRQIRALADGKKNKFTQPEMFTLVRNLLLHNEKIMGDSDFDLLFRSAVDKKMTTIYHLAVSFASELYKEVNINNWWRSGEYAVYPKGFEKEIDKPIGDKVVWIEKLHGKKIAFTFLIPDVRNPQDKNKGLRQASGMLVFSLSKLVYDYRARYDTRTVSVATDFDPAMDVRVVHFPSQEQFRIRHAGKFEEGATGYHGSISRSLSNSISRHIFDAWRTRDADAEWFKASGVAVVCTPLQLDLSAATEELIVKGTPDQIAAALKLLEQLKNKG